VSLDGQVVLITGAGRGIGRGIALRLAREKPAHIVVGYAVDHVAACGTAAEIEASGVPATVASVDVGDERRLRELFDRVGTDLGRLDVFVSNAARTTFRPARELSLRSWQKVMDINARAFLLGSQLAADLMVPAGGGRIVGVSSLGSRYALPDYAALGVAKAALEALARYLAVELAPVGINVNVVCGGFVDTPSMRLAADYPAMAEHVAARTPAGRVGRPEDLAGIVAFLCSPESDWIRGQTLVADGGFSLVLSHRAVP
jgi:enoyl-[acyl-carrier protein] reductase III